MKRCRKFGSAECSYPLQCCEQSRFAWNAWRWVRFLCIGAGVTFVLILVPTICYGIAGVLYGAKGNWPLSIVYAGYSVAHVGLLVIDRMQK